MKKHKLTILNVSQNYHIRGGSDRMFFMTAELLREKGHEVIPFAARHPANNPTDWAEYFPEAANFENPTLVDAFRYVYSYQAKSAISRLLRATAFDLAHLNIYYGKLTPSILSPLKQFGIPIVQTLHEYKLICPVYTLLSNGELCEACEGKHFWRALPKKCNRNSLSRTMLSVLEAYTSSFLGGVSGVDHFIAVSNFVREKMIQYGVPPEKISTVHNFIDYPVTVNNQPGKYFLYVGRIERVKGLATLVQAAASFEKIPLLIVGEGSFKSELEKMIDSQNLSHIKLLGFKQGKELQQLILDSICMILPSEWHETFGLTILEAFAHSRPAIGSDLGGITEVISEGIDGWLFSPGDVEALRDKMQWLLSHPRQAVEMGINGRNKVERDFSRQNYYDNLMRVYGRFL